MNTPSRNTTKIIKACTLLWHHLFQSITERIISLSTSYPELFENQQKDLKRESKYLHNKLFSLNIFGFRSQHSLPTTITVNSKPLLTLLRKT